MKNTFHKVLITIICVLLLIVLGGFLKIFVIGEPVDGAQVYIATSVNEQGLELRVETAESGVALRGWKFKQDGRTLIISARKVLVSSLFNKGNYETTIDLDSIDSILFGGREIWTDKD